MKIIKDISEQKFGKLTAKKPLRTEKGKGIIWLCKCECGNEKEVPASRLLRGTTKSCGCLKEEKRRKQNITGQRFGSLVAEEFLFFDGKYRDCWRFRCDCGNEKIMPAANVKWGRVRSCGCLLSNNIGNLNKQNIEGKRFGRLTAVKTTQKRDAAGSIVWECKCDCGNTVFHSVNALNSGKILSCGCLYNESRKTCWENRKDLIEDTIVSQLIVSKGVRNNNTSGCTGVYYNKRSGKWESYINFQKKRYFLGSYSEKISAIYARKNAERELHDPFILEKFDCLDEKEKKEFLEYLKKEGKI